MKQTQKTVWVIRLPIPDTTEDLPCMEVFVFDATESSDQIIENLSKYAELKGNPPGSFLLLDQAMLTSTLQLAQKALADIEVPKGDDTIN